MAVEVGQKRKKKLSTTLNTVNSPNAKSGVTGSVSKISTGIDALSSDDQQNQNLAIKQQQAQQVGAAQKAEAYQTQMNNRSWFQKLTGYDPSSNGFMNTLNVLFSPLNWADTAVMSGVNAATDTGLGVFGGGFDYSDAKDPFTDYWNKATPYGVSDFITDNLGKTGGYYKGVFHGSLSEAKQNVQNRTKKYGDTKLGQTTGGKWLGFGLDLFSPSQLLLDFTGVGEADAAVKIAGSAAEKAASAGKGVEKVAKAAKDAEDLNEVNSVVKSAKDISKEPVKGSLKASESEIAQKAKMKKDIAEGHRGDTFKSTETLDNLAKEGGKSGKETNNAIRAVDQKHTEALLNHIKKTGNLPESLKGNHTWEAIAEHGKKTDYSKSWKNGAKVVNAWHSGNEGAIKDATEYARHMKNFSNGAGTKFKNIREAIQNDKGFVSGKKVKIQHALHQALDWATNGPIKGILAGKNAIARGLDKYGKTGRSGAKVAKATSQALRPFKYGGVSLLNRNKNLSGDTISSLNRTEHAKNLIKEKYSKELHNYSHNLDNTSNLVKRIIDGKETPESLKKLEKVKGAENIVKQAEEIASKKGIKKGLKKQFADVDKLHAEGKDSLKGVTSKIELPKSDNEKISSNSYTGKALHADLANDAKKYNEQLRIMMEADKTLSLKDAETKLAKQDPKFRVNQKYFQDLDNGKRITSLKDNAITNAYQKLKNLKNYTTSKLDKDLESKLSKVNSKKDWDKLTRLEKDAIIEKYRPLHQLIDNYGRDGENTFGRNFLKLETDNKDWAVYKKLQDISNDKSEFLDKVHRQVVAKTAEVNINDLDKLSPKIQNLHHLDAVENVKSGYVRQWLDNYLSTALSGHENKKTYRNSVLSSIAHLGDNGKYELADRGTLKETQDKMLTERLSKITGEKLSPTKAYERIDQIQKDANRIRSKQLYSYIAEVKKTNPGLSTYEAESKAREMLQKKNPGLSKKLDLADKVNTEIERISEYGSQNTEEFVKNFDKHILGSQIENKVEKHTAKIENAAKEKVQAKLQEGVNKQSDELLKIKDKLDAAKTEKTRAKYEELYNNKKADLKTFKKNFMDSDYVKNLYDTAKEVGIDDLPSVDKYKESLLNDNYRLDYQTDAGTGRATPYRTQGRILNMLPKGKETLNKFYTNLRDPDVQKTIINISKENTISPDNYEFLQKKLGLDEEGVKWLTGEQTFDSYGRLSDSDAKDFASTIGNYRIASLQDLKNQIIQTNNNIVHEVGEMLGIDPTTIDVSPLWYRAVAADTYSRDILSGLDLNGQTIKSPNNIPDLKKLYTKTLATKAIDTNKLFGDTFMQMDPIHNIADKLSLTHQQFELHNILKAGVESGDIGFVSNEKATQYFAALEQTKIRNKKAKLTSKYINTKEVIPLKDGKFLVSTKSMLEGLQTLGNVFSEKAYTDFKQSLLDKANIFIPKDIENGESDLAKTYMSVPNQLYTAITQHKRVFNPENEDIHNIFTWLYKKGLTGWKKLTLTTPGYAIRNVVTTWYNHYLAGLPVAKSALERSKAWKDMAVYRGVTNQFTKQVIKKGIVHKIDDEMQLIGKSAKESKQAITKSQVLDRLLAKGSISESQHKLGKELIDLENRSILGGIRVHADAGHLIQTQQVLANKYVRDIAKISKNKTVNVFKKMYALTIGGLTDANMRLAAWQDDAARLATYRMLDKDPDLLRKLGHESAEAGTRFINLDYQNMTDFEKNKMRWFMPFYSYARQSFAMHLANFLNRPAGYAKINSEIQKSYSDYGFNDDTNGVPQWMRDEMYIPFMNDSQVGILKPDLPYQDLVDGYNMLVGGAANFNNPDKFEKSTLSTSAKNMVSKFNPLLKAMFETAGGKSLYSDETNDSNWYKALWDEFGGVFSKIPNLVKNALNSGDDSLVDNLLDNLTGMSKHYDKSKIKKQRIAQLISYIEDELERHVGYVESVQRIKGEMYGSKPQHAAFSVPRAKKYTKLKKKKYKDLANQV